MASAATFILGKKHIPLDSVRLGRLVTNKAIPHESYYEPSPAIDWTSFVTDRANYSAVDSSSRHKNWHQKMMSLVSLGFSKQSSLATLVKTTRAREHLLDNSKEYFSKLLDNPKAKEWIESTYNDGEEIYFVVGFVTFVDAHITECKVEFKLSDVSLGGFSAVIDGSVNSGNVIKSEDTVLGEQVYALMYHKVKTTVHKGKYHDAKLKKSEWMVTTNKQRQAQTTEADEIMEAEIVESEFDEDDAEGWTKLVDEGSDFYL